MVEQFTSRETEELDRIHRKFQDIGDIRLGLMHKEEVRRTNRWNIAKCLSLVVAIVGEGMHLVGKIRGDGRLSNVGEFSRNLGLITTVVSWMGAGFSDVYAKDAQIRLLLRESFRKRR